MHIPARGRPFTGSQHSLQDLRFNQCNLSPKSSGFSFLDLHWRIQRAPTIRLWKHNSQPHSESISALLSKIFSPCLLSWHVSWMLLGAGWDHPLAGPTGDLATWYQGWHQGWLRQGRRHSPWGKESSWLLAGLIFMADWNGMDGYGLWKKQQMAFFFGCHKFPGWVQKGHSH